MADEKRELTDTERVEAHQELQVKAEKEQDSAADNRPQDLPADLAHLSHEPTEEDYERARTVGIANEPELPPGKVDNTPPV